MKNITKPEEQIDILEGIDKNMPFCPICHDIEENKGYHNIKICRNCAKIMLDKIKSYENFKKD